MGNCESWHVSLRKAGIGHWLNQLVAWRLQTVERSADASLNIAYCEMGIACILSEAKIGHWFNQLVAWRLQTPERSADASLIIGPVGFWLNLLHCPQATNVLSEASTLRLNRVFTNKERPLFAVACILERSVHASLRIL
jgi:hypothetical protein